MARNTGTGGRLGPIHNRTQTYNPKTEQFVKRDDTTGKFVAAKATPYKSVRRDETAKKQENKIETTNKK